MAFIPRSKNTASWL